MRARVVGRAHLLERNGDVEVGFRVQRIQMQCLAVTCQRFGIAAKVVVDVAEIEVRFEEI